MQLSSKELEAVLGGYFPKAVIYTLDRNYELTERRRFLRSLKRFRRVMTVFGLTKWTAHKMDCDKWAWLFKAFRIVKAYFSCSRFAEPTGLICFRPAAKPWLGHAINISLVEASGMLELLELDAMPGRGLTVLTKEERESTWLIII